MRPHNEHERSVTHTLEQFHTAWSEDRPLDEAVAILTSLVRDGQASQDPTLSQMWQQLPVSGRRQLILRAVQDLEAVSDPEFGFSEYDMQIAQQGIDELRNLETNEAEASPEVSFNDFLHAWESDFTANPPRCIATLREIADGESESESAFNHWGTFTPAERQQFAAFVRAAFDRNFTAEHQQTIPLVAEVYEQILPALEVEPLAGAEAIEEVAQPVQGAEVSAEAEEIIPDETAEAYINSFRSLDPKHYDFALFRMITPLVDLNRDAPVLQKTVWTLSDEVRQEHLEATSPVYQEWQGLSPYQQLAVVNFMLLHAPRGTEFHDFVRERMERLRGGLADYVQRDPQRSRKVPVRTLGAASAPTTPSQVSNQAQEDQRERRLEIPEISNEQRKSPEEEIAEITDLVYSQGYSLRAVHRLQGMITRAWQRIQSDYPPDRHADEYRRYIVAPESFVAMLNAINRAGDGWYEDVELVRVAVRFDTVESVTHQYFSDPEHTSSHLTVEEIYEQLEREGIVNPDEYHKTLHIQTPGNVDTWVDIQGEPLNTLKEVNRHYWRAWKRINALKRSSDERDKARVKGLESALDQEKEAKERELATTGIVTDVTFKTIAYDAQAPRPADIPKDQFAHPDTVSVNAREMYDRGEYWNVTPEQDIAWMQQAAEARGYDARAVSMLTYRKTEMLEYLKTQLAGNPKKLLSEYHSKTHSFWEILAMADAVRTHQLISGWPEFDDQADMMRRVYDDCLGFYTLRSSYWNNPEESRANVRSESIYRLLDRMGYVTIEEEPELSVEENGSYVTYKLDREHADAWREVSREFHNRRHEFEQADKYGELYEEYKQKQRDLAHGKMVAVEFDAKL